MRKAEQKDYDSLMEFLKQDIPNCLYIYADLVSLGLDSPNLIFWIEENGSDIKNVVMQYYNSLQLYGKFDDDDFKWIVQKMKSENLDRVRGKDTDVKRMKEYLPTGFSDHYGVIFSFDNSTEIDYKDVVIEATADDADAIADLILMDKKLSGGYTKEELVDQLTDRISNKTGRSFIIKEDDRVIGHICFMIETDLFCVTSWIIVHPDCRNFKYALQLQHATFEITKKENKDHYFFIDNPRRAKMFEVTGNAIVAKYGNIVKDIPGVD